MQNISSKTVKRKKNCWFFHKIRYASLHKMRRDRFGNFTVDHSFLISKNKKITIWNKISFFSHVWQQIDFRFVFFASPFISSFVFVVSCHVLISIDKRWVWPTKSNRKTSHKKSKCQTAHTRSNCVQCCCFWSSNSNFRLEKRDANDTQITSRWNTEWNQRRQKFTCGFIHHLRVAYAFGYVALVFVPMFTRSHWKRCQKWFQWNANIHSHFSYINVRLLSVVSARVYKRAAQSVASLMNYYSWVVLC